MSRLRQARVRDPSALGEAALRPSIEGAVAAARDFLGMEVAFASEFVGDRQVLHNVTGDGGSFGIAEGTSARQEEFYCRRILEGRLPHALPDVRRHGDAADMPITEAASVRAFVSVPITFSNGELYGTLCAASHDVQPSLGDRDVQFLHVLARIIGDQLERERLVDVARRFQVQATATSTLSAALAARDGYTADHSDAVVGLSCAVGRRLGLDDGALADVERTALLHDIGKIAIPDAVLNKPEPLDEQEWEVMHRHPVFGAQLMAQVPGLERLAPVVRAEHERWDGLGYPDGLAGEEIPLPSRIAFVCDAYHAMTSDRPYRPALGHQRAVAEIAANAGTQFCPTCSRILLDLLRERPGA